MNQDEIRSLWKTKEPNRQAASDLWDSMAKQYSEYRMPTFEEDPFLKLVDRLGVLQPNAAVLDVGCGSGRYSLAMADRCKSVTGVDLSQKMLELALREKEQRNIRNVNFMQTDWHLADLTEMEMAHRYDLVFAHMTPAIQSAETFEKMNKACKGTCIMVKPTRRTDPVSDAVRELADIPSKKESGESDLMYAFGLLWQQGYEPKVEYRKEEWDMKKTLDEAYGLYINRMKSYRNISADTEEVLKDYIRSLSIDGIVHEVVNTTIVTLYWNV
ncbi:MAG: class I SAM-dependent methyltransferase [Anaerofustis sp.]